MICSARRMALEAASRLDVMNIPLKSFGDGTGVSYLTLKSDVNTTVTISGTGRFYTNDSGTAGESTTSALSAGVVKTLYVKCTSGTCTVSIRHKSRINELGVAGVTSFMAEMSNGPVLNDFNVSTAISPNARVIRLICTNSSVSGALQAWPSLTYVYFIGNLISVSGALQAWPSLKTVIFNGNLISVSGELQAWPRLTSVYFIGNLISVSGALQAWPSVNTVIFNGNLISVSGELQAWHSLTYVYFSGNLISVSGELQAWPSVTYVYFSGNSISYSTATAFHSSMRRVYINPKSGFMISADVDRLLNQLKLVTSWNTEKEVYLAGRCGAHTSASDDAIATIRALGCTVTVNYDEDGNVYDAEGLGINLSVSLSNDVDKDTDALGINVSIALEAV